MSSSSSSSSPIPSASASFSEVDLTDYPLITPKQKEKKDWVKIAAIAAAILGGLIIAPAVLAIMNMLPASWIGGTLGIEIMAIAGAAILLPAAYVLLDKWQNQPS